MPFPNVTVSGCDPTDNICRFNKDKPPTIELTFRGIREGSKLFASAKVTERGSWMTVMLDEPVCPKLTHGKCPVTRGGIYTYSETSLVGRFPAYHRHAEILKLRVQDEKKEDVACLWIQYKMV